MVDPSAQQAPHKNYISTNPPILLFPTKANTKAKQAQKSDIKN
jgi:hypothetical protein